ncbi:unnamed protein product [Sphagnum balticum]
MAAVSVSVIWTVKLHCAGTGRLMGGVAVNVAYRLAPEHPFPQAVYDAYDSLLWTSTHLTELGINPRLGFIIGGISAGANLAAVAAHLYKSDKRSPPLTGQYLSIPTTCDPSAVPPEHKAVYLSREQNKNALILNQKSIDMFEDPLRDEGLIYEQVLREQGVKTRLDIFPGLPHGFWSWFPEAEFSKSFQVKTVEGLRWLLAQVA